MTSEEEERIGAIEATTNAASSSSAQAEEAATTPGSAAEMATGGATTATAMTATTATGAGDAATPPENTRIRDSLEAIKTAVVWLVVINILTVLSPLLQAPLKWTLAIGVLLIVGSLTIGCVAYLKARSAQERRIAE
jgi:hypothetical protein